MSAPLSTIAIIGGTGAEGSGIAVRLAHAGHRVILGSRDQAKAAGVASELNGMLGQPRVSGEINDRAAAAADIVVLTVPYAAQLPTAQSICAELRGKILIDATAPLKPPKVSVVQLPDGQSAVARLQAELGQDVRVVSAFQNVSAHKLRNLATNVDCDVLVCADDPDARAIAIDLVESIGLRGIDAGPLANSVAAEALTSLLIHINRKYKVSGAGISITGLGE